METPTKFPNMFDKDNPPQTYPAGTVLFHAGEPGDDMYVVKSGEVEIVVGETVVETVSPEGIFGEMALIDNEPRSAMARAKTECQLQTITPRQFIFMVHETPAFAIVVMRIMSHRLRSKNHPA